MTTGKAVKRKIMYAAIGVSLIVILDLMICYGIVSWNASGRLYNNSEDVPSMEYGLLLGTSPITPQGAHNYYFDNRIKAAVELYNAGKVKKIIASGGDYSGKEKYGCNELGSMRDSLVAHGVPASSILLDYEGLRTINSIVKVKEKLGIDSCVIISQGYHNARAIWQADHYGLKAIGYNAAPSHIRRNRIKNIAREVFARPKMFLDLWFGRKPQFQTQEIIYAWYPPAIEEFRDTIVGVFNGIETDTLIAEPIGEYLRNDICSGYYDWKVRAVNQTVADFSIKGQTSGIHFVKEGDLDNDGSEEWGYVTQWPTSNWMNYHLFTNVNGHWKHMIEPTPVWLCHLDKDNGSGWYSPAEDLVRSSNRKKYLQIKFSDVRHEGEDFMLIDTVVRINPTELIGFE